ncbi:Titin like [Dissostichus eleginoides]|uniref:Titin like n=1 Tax=Dissostichus eleginoides TaxID=100907 RepID=A0AAD9BT10_DISEL|nr:Titin like [Dissostichus eleginoides]
MTLKEQSRKAKAHKAMSDSEWMSRLRKFASTGAWPAGEGNRPAPRQKKWFELYQRIEKCPMQAHGQKSFFGQVRQCTCGFHPQKPAATPVQGAVGQQSAASGPVHRPVGQQSAASGPVHRPVGQQSAASGPVHRPVGQQSAASGPVRRATGQQSSAGTVQGAVGHQQTAAEGHLRTPLNLSMFTKSRFGGAHAALAKPNLSTARPRKATETHVTDPTEASTSTYPTERSFSTAPSVAVSINVV